MSLAGDAPEVVLQLDGVMKQFGTNRRRHTAVSTTSLELTNKSRIGVIGESGSGKSTLARILVGLERPTTGAVFFGGQDLGAMLRRKAGRVEFRRSVQFVGQDTTSSFDPRHRLIESVVRPSMYLRGLTREDATARAHETIQYLGLSSAQARRFPGEVSGGQRQRFAIARALVVRPRILICDEVVSALDVSVQGSILNLLKKYCQESAAGLVFVSHGLPATAFIADELLVMYMGSVVERGATDDVVDRPRHEYTRFLLGAHRGSVEQRSSL